MSDFFTSSSDLYKQMLSNLSNEATSFATELDDLQTKISSGEFTSQDYLKLSDSFGKLQHSYNTSKEIGQVFFKLHLYVNNRDLHDKVFNNQ